MAGKTRTEDERNFAPHAGDGWAQTTTRHDQDCPRCGARILPGELVVASGYVEHPILWICRRHSNIAARPLTPDPSTDPTRALTDVERDMARAYVEVHSRKINAHMRESLGSASARTELELALREARGVAAALERLLAADLPRGQEGQ